MHWIGTKIWLILLLLVTSCTGQFKFHRAQQPTVSFAFVAPEQMQAGVEFVLSWSAIPNAVHYTLVISNDAVCADPVFKLNKLSTLEQSITLTATGDYFACVYATMPDGSQVAASNNGMLLRVQAQPIPDGLPEFKLSSNSDIWGIDSEAMSAGITATGRDNVLFKLDKTKSTCDDLTWTDTIAMDKDGKITGTPAAQTDVVNCTLVVTASSVYDSVTATFEVTLYPKHPAGFLCSGGGDLKTVCKVNTLQNLANNLLIAGPGSIVVQSGGDLRTALTEVIAIKMGNDFTVEASGIVATNMSTLDADNIVVEAGGKIDVSALGFSGGDVSGSDGQGPGRTIGIANATGGASHGGNGGDNSSTNAGGSATIYGSASAPVTFGSGAGGSSWSTGGRGGNGGGRLKLNARNSVRVDGDILALGGDGDVGVGRGGGGGSGGSIWVNANTLTGTGNMSAKGGRRGSGNSHIGGGGGGGRIAVIAKMTTFSGTIDVDFHVFHDAFTPGKFASSGSYYSDIENICDSGTRETTCVVTKTKILGGGDVITIPGNLVVNATGVIKTVPVLSTATLNVGGTMTVNSGANIIANLSVIANSVDIQSGATYSAQALGYDGGGRGANGRGPGGGPHLGTSGGSGSHGGMGGTSANGATGGAINGTNISPTEFGSGGGSAGTATGNDGGNGGGVIKITASQLIRIDGTLTVRGGDAIGTGRGTGGGAGGSIWLQTSTLAGAGSILAPGGDGNGGGAYFGGGGGGGRIALEYGANTFSGTISAAGGIRGGGAATDGSAGTICHNGAGGSC